MKKEEKKILIMLADSLLKMYELGLLEQTHIKTMKETFEGLEVEKEDDWDKIMEDNFHSFLKHVHGLHNMVNAKETHDNMKQWCKNEQKPCKDQRSTCQPSAGTSIKIDCPYEPKECEFNYIYTVYLDDHCLDVEGNGWCLDDDNLRIYFDHNGGKVKAYFPNVQGFTISPVEKNA